MKRLQVNIRDLLYLTTIVAVLAAWWLDRSRLAAKIETPRMLMVTPGGPIEGEEEPPLRIDPTT